MISGSGDRAVKGEVNTRKTIMLCRGQCLAAWVGVAITFSAIPQAGATTDYYVSTNGADAADGLSWATAKETIQAAIDLTVVGDRVLVSNGVYATGGGGVNGVLTNRVAITNAITVQAVNGPLVTVIRGAFDPLTTNGPAAVRCVYIGSNAVLSGFTLTNGATYLDTLIVADRSGGGVWCESYAVVSNCVLTGNSARGGGGSYGGTLIDCALSGNSALQGGGSYSATLIGCTLSGNSAYNGGGAVLGTLSNCTLSGNLAYVNHGGGSYGATLIGCTLSNNYANYYGGGASGGSLTNCTLLDNSSGMNGGGVYNATLHNCVLQGNTATNGGASYNGVLSHCDLLTNSGVNGGASYGGTLYDCVLQGNTATNGGGSYGGALSNCVLQENSALYGGGAATSTLFACTLSGNRVTYEGAGAYCCAMSNCTLSGNAGLTENCLGGGAYGGTLFNCTLGTNAARNGGGTYNAILHGCALQNNSAQFGGGSYSGSLSNCLLLANTATLSGGGASHAILYDCVLRENGAQFGGGAKLSTLYNCTLSNNVGYVTGGGSDECTLTHCALLDNRTALNFDCRGGGAAGSTLDRCRLSGNRAGDGGAVMTCTVSNSTLNDNHANWWGGGAYGGTLYNCTLSGNTAVGGPGGGAYAATLSNCLISGNLGYVGGGVYQGTLYNCVVADNHITADDPMGIGSGADDATLYNCTVVNNRADYYGSGTWECEVWNSIVYSNWGYCASTPVMINYIHSPPLYGFLQYSCTTPHPGGDGNITDDPRFVNAGEGIYRLQPSSPCINAGNSAYAPGTTDLDGNPRIQQGSVDMGAYEFQPMTNYLGWSLQIPSGAIAPEQCGLGDGYPNLLKYATGSSATQSDDLARLIASVRDGLFTMQFNRNTNATDVTLYVESCTSLAPAPSWTVIAANRAGTGWNSTQVSETGSGTPVVVTVSTNTAGTNSLFMRLSVTAP